MTEQLPPSRDVEYEVTRLLRRSRQRGMQVIGAVHPELDFATYLLLVAIYESADPERVGVRGSELAEISGVHKSTVSRGLTTLEELGLVQRVTDPTDGRARLVAVTPEAAERIERVRAQRHARLAGVLADWEADDLSRLAHLLERLNTALDG
ncbi:MAG: MarR family transcriptional regulator [Nocardioidaceae bacterium]|nr:MarR family transcriptional regulator [Nocardioidaceae bacterium]